jgi:hypothetical protein
MVHVRVRDGCDRFYIRTAYCPGDYGGDFLSSFPSIQPKATSFSSRRSFERRYVGVILNNPSKEES